MTWSRRRLFQDWPMDAQSVSVDKLIELYSNGFMGAKPPTQEVLDQFNSTQQWPNGEDAAHEFGFADSGAGKLVIPYIYVLLYYPGAYPGSAQERGDCVSHGWKNGGLVTMCCDVASGLPDKVSGKPERAPEVSEAGIKSGVLSTETVYWWRGYDGDGWMCPASANVGTTKSGLFVRRNYTEFGVDLTTYSGRNAGLYGARSPSGVIAEMGTQHLIHQATNISSFEATRDFLFNGYGIQDCGSEGYANTRDQYGISRRSGSWAHSMSNLGVDDRDVIKQLIGEPLVLTNNSWAKWNSGPRDIYKSDNLVPPGQKDLWIKCGLVNPSTGNIMIPEGSFWTPWSHCKNRERFAYSGVNGWPRKSLPHLGTSIWG